MHARVKKNFIQVGLAAIVTIAIAMVSSCGGGEYVEPPDNPEHSVANYQKGLSGDEFYTIDIAKYQCVVYNGERKGGLYCFDKTAPVPVPSPSYG
jgi:hypothetical protein